MNVSPFLTINHPCNQALQWTYRRLREAGLRSVQTFDLLAARAGSQDCPCPNHGTSACDCQMVIVLVYGETVEPTTLILHGQNGQTWFSIVDAPGQNSNVKTVIAIRNSLTRDASLSLY